MSETRRDLDGGFLCGAVRFTLRGAPDTVSVCHCETCRKWSGGPMMAVEPERGIDFGTDATLVWYRSSDWAERGFCSACGASLFYRLVARPDDVAVAAGAVDDAMAFGAIERHIFIDEQPAFYAFADEAERLTGKQAIALFTGEEQSP